jgi:serine/threonine-protein kinase
MNNATQSFLGRYRLVKVLGQGAMGVVYEAVDTRLNRTVAIKTVLRSHLADETTANEYATRFEREAQAAARLSHPHVVTVFDFGEHEDISYIVMEFIRGRELNQAFESGQAFPLPEAIRIMCELLQALDYAHRQGIVHRDIKPANVMLDAGNRVKLTDFGVARVASATQDRTMPGTLVGTPSYMSPEQILGLAVGSRADIFAAGVILYQFLTGKRPFSGGGPFGVQRKIVQDDPEPPSKVNPALPQGFDLIISRALAKQPENRYENAAAFAADLERIAASLPRQVPLIDLDLPDSGASTPSAGASGGNSSPAPATAAAATPDFDPELTLISALPFASPTAPPARDPDETTLDPEATIIQFRPTAPAPQRTASLPPPAAVPTPAPPAVRTMQGREAPGPAPAAPPPPAPVRPAATASVRPAPGPQAPVRPAGTARAPTARPTVPAPAPAPKRSLLPAAAGAGVAVVVLAAWLLVARPWSAKDAPVAEPAAGAVKHSPAPAAAPPAPAPAPAAAATTPASPPAVDPPVVVRPTAPADAPAKKPVRESAPAHNPPPARPAAVVPDANPGGIEPRCGDLLQRMQLGEPLTPEQTRFFQTRCTR